MKYLKFVLFLASCGPQPKLPPGGSASELLCAKAAKCELVTQDEVLVCRKCVDAYFEDNGGAAKFEGVSAQYINGSCKDLKNLAESVGTLKCVKKSGER